MEVKHYEEMRTKRQQILEAAYTVFSKKGYNRATVDEIIQLADTGKGTVYNYFSSKEQLFYTLIKERSAPFKQALTAVFDSPKDPLHKVQEMIELFLRFYIENGELWRVVMHEMRGIGCCEDKRQRYEAGFSETIGMLEKVLGQGVEQGVFKHCDAHKLAYSLFSVIVMVAFQNFVTDIKQDAQSIAAVFFYGIVKGS